MPVADPEQLEEIGLVLYERRALMALMLCGVADAATLCREGSVPTSKIYLAMEKLAGLGLVQVQPTRPKMFAALPTDVVVNRIIEIAKELRQLEQNRADRQRPQPSHRSLDHGIGVRIPASQPIIPFDHNYLAHVAIDPVHAGRGPRCLGLNRLTASGSNSVG